MEFIRIALEEESGQMDRELRRTIDEMLRLAPPRFTLSAHSWQPSLDMYETERNVFIQAELAGIRREDLHVEVSAKTIRISGYRRTCTVNEEVRYRIAEIPYGPFERSLALPAQVDTGAVAATYAEGLLVIRLVKIPAGRIRRIAVTRG